MYSCLVAAACLSWWLLLGLRRRRSWPWTPAYIVVLATVVYLHPLGLFLVSTHAVVALLARRSLGLSWGRWLVIQAAVGLLIAPALSSYLGGRPDYLQERTSLRLLLATPIGFVGGNRLALAACLALIGWGAVRLTRRRGSWPTIEPDRPGAALLAGWFTLPLLQLALYSALRHPIAGPDRYTLYVAPAYLLLLARGLAKVPTGLGLALAAAGTALSVQLLGTLVFDADARPGWREAAAVGARERPRVLVMMLPADAPYLDKELATSRYYLGPDLPILPVDVALEALVRDPAAVAPPRCIATARRGARVLAEVPPALLGPGTPAVRDVPGMRLYLVRGG